jgi:PAS domain S-box-containing protein
MNTSPEILLKYPGLEKYLISFHAGDILCAEGNESKDLYLLLDGRLEIMKGQKKVAEVVESGAPVGEISFLLEARRTATVRAVSDGRAACIPKDQIEQFLQEFPSLAWKIPRVLAARLDEETQAFQGLSELCDQLPEAVIATGPEGRIMAWNKPAEKLFGANWEQLHNRPAEELYQDAAAYRDLEGSLQATSDSREQTLMITHPGQGTRYVSTTLKAIYDRHAAITGFLALSRDVTDTITLRRNYRRIRTWLLPALAALGLLAVVLFFFYPRAKIAGIKQQVFTDQIAKDYLVLKSLLADPLPARDEKKIAQLMNDFFRMHGKSPAPYRGILLLTKDKKVFDFYSEKTDTAMKSIAGRTYEGITFRKNSGSNPSIFTVYHVTPGHPMGKKSVELAFELRKAGELTGWVVFQMDMERLQQEFGMNEEMLGQLEIE